MRAQLPFFWLIAKECSPSRVLYVVRDDSVNWLLLYHCSLCSSHAPLRREKHTYLNQMRQSTGHSIARRGPWCLYYEARQRKTQQVQKTGANPSSTSSMLLLSTCG